MPFYKNIVFVTGAIALAYMMLKLFINNGEDAPNKKCLSDDSEQIKNKQTDKNIGEKTDTGIVEASESKHKLDNSQSEGKEKVMKLLKAKPNFFIAIKVDDVGIHRNVKKLQEKILAKNSQLHSALVKVSTLHVTLAVTHLPTEKDIKIVKDELQKWAEKGIKTFFEKPCILNFTGVKTFNNAVAYVSLEECENYKKISELSENMNHILSSAGYSTDNKSFRPHLTFLKLSKDFKLFRLRKKFLNDFEGLKECKEHFGSQEVSLIQLLHMVEPKDKFGYYKCYHEIKVSDTKQDMDHSECCTPIQKPKVNKKVK